MKTQSQLLALAAAMTVVVSMRPAAAQTRDERADSVRAEIRKELLQLPYYSVFDFLAFKYDRGTAVRDHDQLAQDDHRIRVYVDSGESAMPAILRALNDSHVVVDTVSLSRPSLDHVFLRQTGRSLREEVA